MKLILYAISLALSLSHCATKNNEQKLVVANEPQGYYSDYFVFIADDDESSPLVIPIDINWRISKRVSRPKSPIFRRNLLCTPTRRTFLSIKKTGR